ncbi:MAG: hypothetical protein DHS20C16_36940 [Phycisphaerae bacterium]|nr:MAG: hypothetical protein DHS20C16_36940 [Phycisphaerae bacterium]
MVMLAFWGMADATDLGVRQITHGPQHHFYGYIGHVGNTPWSGDGRHLVMLRTGFQDRMPEPGEPADIVLIDTANDYRVENVEKTRAWNFQQGTMLYWNPQAPDTQFFFNDRDPETHAVFCVLYDVAKRARVREYRFDDVPIGNSGVSRDGRSFLAINYGRLGRLRPVTGYPGALDTTEGEKHPDTDGVFKVDVTTGVRTLLISYAELADQIRASYPQVSEMGLFINHTLWSRENDQVLCYVRGGWDSSGTRATRIDVPFTMNTDGRDLRIPMKHVGGHPEWAPGGLIVGALDGNQVLFDPHTNSVAKTIGTQDALPSPGADVSLSPDGRWLVNGHRFEGMDRYTFMELESGRHFHSPLFEYGAYRSGPLRIDPAPCWNREGTAIAVPALAPDGTRQTFVIGPLPLD